jgi:hypothetical protein
MDAAVWGGPDQDGIGGVITADRFAVTVAPRREGRQSGYRWIVTFLENPKVRCAGSAASAADARRAAESALDGLRLVAHGRRE